METKKRGGFYCSNKKRLDFLHFFQKTSRVVTTGLGQFDTYGQGTTHSRFLHVLQKKPRNFNVTPYFLYVTTALGGPGEFSIAKKWSMKSQHNFTARVPCAV